MKTVFLLMARYDARAIIPVNEVCRDFFPHLATDKFVRKACSGEINLPIVRMDKASQKAARGVELLQLARFIDERCEAARAEHQAMLTACSTPH